jgi:hypothetical protein
MGVVGDRKASTTGHYESGKSFGGPAAEADTPSTVPRGRFATERLIKKFATVDPTRIELVGTVRVRFA